VSTVEDTKAVIRICKSNKERHCNEQEDKQKTNSDVQSTMQKTKGCEQQTNVFLKCIEISLRLNLTEVCTDQ
jgi:hypothetical protein